MFNRTLAWLGGLALMLMPLGASAGTIYNFTTGSAVVSATIIDTTLVNPPAPVLLNGGPTINVGVIGSFVEFDDTTPELNDFLIQLDDTGVLALSTTSSSDVFGYISAELDSVELAPGGGYVGTNVLGGPNNFTFDVGPIDVSGILTAISGSPPLPPDVGPVPFTQSAPNLTGSISVGLNMIQLSGVTLGAIPNPANPTDLLVFKGDIVFNGSVPEPATLVLLSGALMGLLVVRRR